MDADSKLALQIASAIRAGLEANGESQASAAAEIGTTVGTVYRWCAGRNLSQATAVIRLFRYLDIPFPPE